MRDTVTEIRHNHSTDGHRLIKDMGEENKRKNRSKGMSLHTGSLVVPPCLVIKKKGNYMHTINSPFQARKGQFGPKPEMAFSVALDALKGRKTYHFKFKSTGLEYKFDVAKALEVHGRHRFISRRSRKECLVLPLKFCIPGVETLHKWKDKELFEKGV